MLLDNCQLQTTLKLFLNVCIYLCNLMQSYNSLFMPNRMIPLLFTSIMTVFQSTLAWINNTSNILQKKNSVSIHSLMILHVPQSSQRTRKESKQLPSTISCCHYINPPSLVQILWKFSWKQIISLSNVQPRDFFKKNCLGTKLASWVAHLPNIKQFLPKNLI